MNISVENFKSNIKGIKYESMEQATSDQIKSLII